MLQPAWLLVLCQYRLYEVVQSYLSRLNMPKVTYDDRIRHDPTTTERFPRFRVPAAQHVPVSDEIWLSFMDDNEAGGARKLLTLPLQRQ